MAEVRYRETIDISVAPASVYAFRLDFDNLPAVNPDVADFRRTDGGTAPGVGATYEFTVTTDYGTLPCTLRVVEAGPPVRIVNVMNAGLDAREVCTFSPAGNGTHVEFEVTVTVPDDLDEAGRAFIEQSGRKPVRTELETMKKILES